MVGFILWLGVRVAPILMNKFDPPRVAPIVLSSECNEAIEHLIAVQLPSANPREVDSARDELRKRLCPALTRDAYHCLLRARSVPEFEACAR
ncbi:MAG: hypothetical protein Q8L48_27790 [Archangium sp.]|nr:hypothetical protein [Archangium sp.]